MSITEIAWKHWEEPINPAQEIIEYLSDKNEGDDEDLEMEFRSSFIMTTPLGNFWSHDELRPSVMFGCWVMHTNDDITLDIANQIGKIPGVEAAKVLTRYRCFIGVSPMFTIRDVRISIQEALIGTDYQDQLQKLEEVEESLSDYEFWTINIGNDSLITSHGTNDPKDPEYLKFLQEIRGRGLSYGSED